MTNLQLAVLARSTQAAAAQLGIPLMGVLLIQADGETHVVENCGDDVDRAVLIACLVDAADHFLPAERDPAEDPKTRTDGE